MARDVPLGARQAQSGTRLDRCLHLQRSIRNKWLRKLPLRPPSVAHSHPSPQSVHLLRALLQTAPEPEPELSDLTEGLNDQPVILDEGARQVDWTRSYHGLGADPFPKEASDVLLAPIEPDDIEVKPDGILYLPEIKYRRILNKAFGPGGWGLAPRGETIVTQKSVTREYALVVGGRFVISFFSL